MATRLFNFPVACSVGCSIMARCCINYKTVCNRSICMESPLKTMNKPQPLSLIEIGIPGTTLSILRNKFTEQENEANIVLYIYVCIQSLDAR